MNFGIAITVQCNASKGQDATNNKSCCKSSLKDLVRQGQAGDSFAKRCQSSVGKREGSLRLSSIQNIKSFESFTQKFNLVQAQNQGAEEQRDAQEQAIAAGGSARRVGGGRFDSDEEDIDAKQPKKRQRKGGGKGGGRATGKRGGAAASSKAAQPGLLFGMDGLDTVAAVEAEDESDGDCGINFVEVLNGLKLGRELRPVTGLVIPLTVLALFLLVLHSFSSRVYGSLLWDMLQIPPERLEVHTLSF
jgi:hypothetical protein